ncbi:imidazole glycerol phosphate synthase subunit HisH [Oceanospirillum sanctuarii]|uniref:imidazole glycerol phosphate synthase subunit HisH n=1 Tax=Oceanospirillum sanctuarii TaxID=1434821 RepID=UPI001120174D|nr:imidazole glycerol phosphate synthase subunit HisH [Oceanospirillum sanctuarii]
MKDLEIVIVDYGMGNIRSIENAIKKIGYKKPTVTSDPTIIQNSECIILPGVGAFPDAMYKLQEKKLIEHLENAAVVKKTPTLGICLGMQLLFEYSIEKKLTKGLGWIPGTVEYIKPSKGLRVPHVGWNSIKKTDHGAIFNYLKTDKDFYFVHSLHAKCEKKHIIAEFDYGETMVAAVKNDNIIGMQFHPEKSQENGLNALKEFFKWASKYHD